MGLSEPWRGIGKPVMNFGVNYADWKMTIGKRAVNNVPIIDYLLYHPWRHLIDTWPVAKTKRLESQIELDPIF